MKINTICAAFAASIALGASVNAANIVLGDASLEAAFTGTNGTAGSGWFTFGQSAAAQQVSGGFWNIGGADGANGAYTTSSSTTDGGSIYQTVELDAGQTYRLTAGVAQSGSVAKNDANFALVFFDAGFGAIQAQF